MADIALDSDQEIPKDAHFEHISIPQGESFLCRIDDYPWELNRWNFHPECEIHLVRKSEGLCFIGDYIGNFEPGHLSIVGSNLPHDWTTLPSPEKLITGRDIIIQFSPKNILAMKNIIPELHCLVAFFERSTLGIEFSGEAAQQGAYLIEAITTAKGVQRFSLFIQLLTLLSTTREAKTLASKQFLSNFKPGNALEKEQIDLALNFIKEKYLLSPKLKEVAKLVNMSESVFSRFFRTQTGNNFSTHITIMRVCKAENLLRDSDLSITDICFESGFSNISNFNRMFLKQTGLRPLQYRKATQLLKA